MKLGLVLFTFFSELILAFDLKLVCLLEKMNLFLFNLALLVLFSRPASSQNFLDRRPFDCDRYLWNKIRNENFTFLFQGKHLFIILAEHLVMFREPTLTGSNEEPANLVIKKSFIVNVEDRLKQGIRGVLDQNNHNIYAIRSNSNGFKCHLIDFNELLREISENPCEKAGLNTTGLLDPEDTYCYSYFQKKPNLPKDAELDVFLKYRKKELVFENREGTSKFQKVIQLGYAVKKAAVDLHYENLVFEIDEEQNGQPVLHANQVKLKRSEKGKLIDFSYGLSYKMTLEDFLGCIRKLDSFDQVKGIFFHDHTVYLVLRQYYVMFEASLIDDRFEGVDENALYKNRSIYRISDYELDKIRFDESRRWVKTIGGEVHLSFNVVDIYNAVFSGKFVSLQRSAKIDRLECDKQTLEVAGDVFCFEEKQYYKMERINQVFAKTNNSKSYPISELFSRVKYFIYEEQNLLFIFNYVENKFIFMTDRYFFTIEHNQVRQIGDGKLVIYCDHVDALDFQENCLLEKCKTAKVKREKNNTYLIAIIVITLATVALSLLVYFFVHKRAPTWRHPSRAGQASK